MKIAVTGKGGVGKTTIAATLARLYAEEGHPVLAADVDPDANLGLALGFPEEILDSIVPITKMRKLIEERTEASADNRFYKINPRVSDIPDKYSKEYMEAGLEHLGRGTTEGMDMFIVVIEPGARSIQTYKNVKRLAEELGVHQVHVVANKVRDEKDEAFIQDRIPPEDLLGMVHYNPEIMEADREGSSPYDYSAAAVEEIRKIKTKIDKSNMPGMEKV